MIKEINNTLNNDINNMKIDKKNNMCAIESTNNFSYL